MQCPDCCGSGQGARSIEWVAGRAHVDHERCQTCGGHGLIEDAPAVGHRHRVVQSGEIVELIEPQAISVAVAVTDLGPRIVLRFDDTRYALSPAAWNELIVTLKRLSEQLGMKTRTGVFAQANDSTGREITTEEAAARA